MNVQPACEITVKTPDKVTYYRYVPHPWRAEYEAIGWVFASELYGSPHRYYSVLMMWGGDGEPREPVK